MTTTNTARPLKRTDIDRCSACGHGVMHENSPMMWKVDVTRYIVDLRAVRSQAGLEMQVGDPFLAHALGPDADLAQPVDGTKRLTLCDGCMTGNVPILASLENLSNEEADDEDDGV